MKEAIATQILLGFLLGHYVVFIDGVSLKSEGGTWGGSLVSLKLSPINRECETLIVDYLRESTLSQKLMIELYSLNVFLRLLKVFQDFLRCLKFLEVLRYFKDFSQDKLSCHFSSHF
jgi:hypothetical protein